MRTLLVVGCLASCASDDTPTRRSPRAPPEAQSSPDTGATSTVTPPTATGSPPTDTSPGFTDTTPATGTPPPTGITPAVDPGAPVFPSTIGTVTVTVRTSADAYAGTDDAAYLCLRDIVSSPSADCLKLDWEDWNNNERGATEVYAFEGVGLARADVTQVALTTVDGTDKWTVACLDVRFDGEPVYCNDAVQAQIGNDVGEVDVWVDPLGLHNACDACSGRTMTHGPLLGAVEPTRIRAGVRTDATRQVALWVSESPDLGLGTVADIAYPTAEEDFHADLVAEGATPGTTYWWGVSVDGDAPTLAGSVTTPPSVGTPTTFRLAFGSCAREDQQPIFAHILDAAPDLFLWAGDNHYANSGDLNTLRRFYRWSWERPERATLLASVPNLATWDDHDFVGNDSHGADLARWPAGERENALRAFQEHWVNPSYGAPGTPGVFFTYAYGDVDFLVLDGRYWRDDPDDVAVPTMLGGAQLDWLMATLRASTATFKVLVTGSTWSPLSENGDDGWASYPSEFASIFGAVASEGIEGVLLLSGDVHEGEFRLIDRSAAGGYDLPEIISSSLAYDSNGSCPVGGDLLYCYEAGDVFATLDFDTLAPDPSVRATLWDVDGNWLTDWTILRSDLE